MSKYKKAKELIKEFEGLKDGDETTPSLEPYLDPVGIWTIGWGHALRDKNGFICGANRKQDAYAVFPGGITIEKAEYLLKKDMRIATKAVKKLVTVPLRNNQLNALISWTFNVGGGNLQKSTLLRLLNLGEYDSVPEQMKRWTKAKGRFLPGLVRRRNAEAKLWSDNT